MATEHLYQPLDATAVTNERLAPSQFEALVVETSDATLSTGSVTTFSMRALADPGPGTVYWTSNSRDYAGNDAPGGPSAIQAGTARVIEVATA